MLRHQNLVGYMDSGLHRPDGDGADVSGFARPYVVTELCAGSLADHLAASPGGRVSAEQAVAILGDVIAGLSHLHHRGLIHRDIKADNVLYGHGTWKLGDFGLMRDLTATGSYHRDGAPTGTPLYMSPELFVDAITSRASDVYAVGVLAHVCATGRPLHSGSGQALLYSIASGLPRISPDLHPVLAELVRRTTVTDPGERPSVEELPDLLHQWPGMPIAPSDPAMLLRHAPTLHSGSFPDASAWPMTPTGFTGNDERPPATPQGVLPSAGQSTSSPAITSDRLSVPGDPWPNPQPSPHHSQLSPQHARHPGRQHSPEDGFQDPHQDPDRAATNSRRRWPVGAMTMITVPAAIVLGIAATWFFLGRSADGNPDRPPGWPDEGGGFEFEDSPFVGPTAEQTDPSTPSGVEIGDGVKIGEGVEIGGEVDIGMSPAALTLPIGETLSHLIPAPCAAEEPTGVVMVTNHTSVPLDYVLELSHYNPERVRTAESYGSVDGLQPGGQALILTDPGEGGSASCEIVSLSATPASDAGSSVADGRIISCQLNEFSGFYDIVYTITNPAPFPVDSDLTIAVVDALGVRLDEISAITVHDVKPGETVQDETSTVFWNLDKVVNVADHCEIVAVGYDEAL